MNHLQFAYPGALFLLILVLIFALYCCLPSLKRKKHSSFLFTRTDIASIPSKTLRVWLSPLPDILLITALSLLVIALARPQTTTAEELEVEGIDIYLALDMSGSMRAIDMSRDEVRRYLSKGKEPINRFESAVETLKGFIRGRQFDRIGMVVFAQKAYLQFPLTLDYNNIINMLARLRLGDIDEGGTAIGNALGRAINGLKDSEAKTKIVILITDGDRRGGNISPQKAADFASQANIKIFPILVGRQGGTLVPVGRNLLSGQMTYQNREFPINPQLLKDIAKKTKGTYHRVADAKGLKERLHDILDQFERTRIKDATNVEYKEHYQNFLWWSVLLLVLQFVLRRTYLRVFP